MTRRSKLEVSIARLSASDLAELARQLGQEESAMMQEIVRDRVDMTLADLEATMDVFEARAKHLLREALA